jgi:hypothetical protein
MVALTFHVQGGGKTARRSQSEKAQRDKSPIGIPHLRKRNGGIFALWYVRIVKIHRDRMGETLADRLLFSEVGR